MIISPDIMLAAIGVIFIVAAILVARIAYRYGCTQKIIAGNRQLVAHDSDTENCFGNMQSRRLIPADNSGEWTETEAVIINSLQGRITVSVIAQPNRE